MSGTPRRCASRCRSCRPGAQQCCGPTRNSLHMLLPLALLAELFDFAFDQVALEHAEMLDEEDTVEVIDLMAEGAGQQIFAANFEGFAFGVLGLHGDKLRAQD